MAVAFTSQRPASRNASVVECLNFMFDPQREVLDAADIHICRHCSGTRVKPTLWQLGIGSAAYAQVLLYCPDCPEGFGFSERLYSRDSMGKHDAKLFRWREAQEAERQIRPS